MSRSSPRDGRRGSPGSDTPISGQALGLRSQYRRKSSAKARGRIQTLPWTKPGASPAVTPAKAPERAASRTARGSARSNATALADRRERRRLQHAVFLRQDERLNLFRVRLPRGILRHPLAARGAVVEAVEAPHEHHLVEIAGLGGEITDELAEVGLLQRQPFFSVELDQVGDLAGMQGVDALFDDHALCSFKVTLPRSIAKTRSTMRSECCRSDSERITDTPSFFKSPTTSARRPASAGATPSKGSSSRSSWVPQTRARASATSFCWPPESCDPLRAASSRASGTSA